MRKLGITSIGSSYDPISNIRGLGANRDWRAYNRRFLDAICLLEEEGFNWGVVYVVTQQSLAQPLEIFNFLTNLSPRRGLRFNPVLVYGGGLGPHQDFPGRVCGVSWGPYFRSGGSIALISAISSRLLLWCGISLVRARH